MYLARCEGGTDLAAVPDPELVEDAAEMALDRAVREEETRRDLTVRHSRGHELGDALLCRVSAGCRRPAADAGELCARVRPRAQRGAAKNVRSGSSTAKASRTRDKAWVADGVISDRWAPVSPSGTLDGFVWRTPDERLAEGCEGPIELTLLCRE